MNDESFPEIRDLSSAWQAAKALVGRHGITDEYIDFQINNIGLKYLGEVCERALASCRANNVVLDESDLALEDPAEKLKRLVHKYRAAMKSRAALPAADENRPPVMPLPGPDATGLKMETDDVAPADSAEDDGTMKEDDAQRSAAPVADDVDSGDVSARDVATGTGIVAKEGAKMPAPALYATGCKLVSPRTGKEIMVYSGNTIGTAVLDRLEEEFSPYYSSSQFALIFRDGAWFLRHAPGAKNATNVDDAPVSGETRLHDGAMIAVGKTKKLPIKVVFPPAPSPAPAAPAPPRDPAEEKPVAPGGPLLYCHARFRASALEPVASGKGGLVHFYCPECHKGFARVLDVAAADAVVVHCDHGHPLTVRKTGTDLAAWSYDYRDRIDTERFCCPQCGGFDTTNLDGVRDRTATGSRETFDCGACGRRFSMLYSQNRDGVPALSLAIPDDLLTRALHYFKGWVFLGAPKATAPFPQEIDTRDLRGVKTRPFVCGGVGSGRLERIADGGDGGDLALVYTYCPAAEGLELARAKGGLLGFCPLCGEPLPARLAPNKPWASHRCGKCGNDFAMKFASSAQPASRPATSAPAAVAMMAVPAAETPESPDAPHSPDNPEMSDNPEPRATPPAPLAEAAPAPVAPPPSPAPAVPAGAPTTPPEWLKAFPQGAQELFDKFWKTAQKRGLATALVAPDDAGAGPATEYRVRVDVAYKGPPLWQEPAPAEAIEAEFRRVMEDAKRDWQKVEEWLDKGGKLEELSMAFGLRLGDGPALRPLDCGAEGWEKLGERLWFVGDVHGDVLGLDAALRHIDEQDEAATIVFLGDLFDSFTYGLETVCRVLARILNHPGKTLWLAGNHDAALCRADDLERPGEKKFAATVKPAEFADFLNDASITDQEQAFRQRLGEKLCELAQLLPRALILPDGTLAAHAGAPHLTPAAPEDAAVGSVPGAAAPGPASPPAAGRAVFATAAGAPALQESALEAVLATPEALRAFVWTRLVPDKKRRRGEEMGYENFRDFCQATAAIPGCAVRRMIRGHDHGGLTRHDFYEQYHAAGYPVLTMTTMGAWEKREQGERTLLGHKSPCTLLCVARHRPGLLPEVHALALPPALVGRFYAAPAAPAP